MNAEQLQDWGAVVTEIRKKILEKAARYKQLSEPPIEPLQEEKSRRSVQQSTRKSNPEGVLELELKARAISWAGASNKSKKRLKKELPPAVRDEIVKMYLEEHVFQADIAQLFKVSKALVSRLVKEAQDDPKRSAVLR